VVVMAGRGGGEGGGQQWCVTGALQKHRAVLLVPVGLEVEGGGEGGGE
jgi:hypothetical protein